MICLLLAFASFLYFSFICLFVYIVCCCCLRLPRFCFSVYVFARLRYLFCVACVWLIFVLFCLCFVCLLCLFLLLAFASFLHLCLCFGSFALHVV